MSAPEKYPVKKVPRTTTGMIQKTKMVFDLYLSGRINAIYNQAFSNSVLHTELTATSYHPSPEKAIVYLVKDIPDYLEVRESPDFQGYAKIVVGQYRGHLIALDKFRNAEEYLSVQLNKRNRKNLRAKLDKLIREHDISFTTYRGAIDKKTHARLFESFHKFLVARFSQKKMANRDLDQWKFLEKKSLSSIRSGEASLFVIYNGQVPIAMTLNFHVGPMLYSHMQTHDIAYSSYGLGDIAMLKQLEWCFANKIRTYDFIIGDSYYKSKWANHNYQFNYHIFYKKYHVMGRILATLLSAFYNLKQYLRAKGIVGTILSRDRWRFKK